ncbi:hypothetical protein CTA1_8202 [Colletotrichum tanaceti]|uniref:F-box domain-containing protein n=1 Tax=Colletotrichum tanaceti TaxID=1306861 RepID=A0A4U6XE89_9PEZI|nr:hypothetical protein CTA1_8202 [Colletotrichum tanaceti]
MAPIDRIHEELILMICRFLHPANVQMDQVYANNAEKGDNGIRRALRPGWTDVFFFSLANKKYRRIIGNDLYHTVSVHGPGLRPLVSLLRLVTKKPDIGIAVKRLHLGLGPNGTTVKAAPLNAYDALFIGQVAAAAELPCPKHMWRILKNHNRRVNKNPLSSRITNVKNAELDKTEFMHYTSGTVRASLIVRLLLRKLKNLEQLGCALPHGAFSWGDDDDQLNLGPRLLRLTTLAVRPAGCQFSGNDLNALSRLATHATCLYLQPSDFSMSGLEMTPHIRQTTFLQFSNIVLCGATNPIAAICYVTAGLFKNLLAFTYVSSPVSPAHAAMLLPRNIIQSLVSHSATSLRSLCLDYSGCCPPPQPVAYSLRWFVHMRNLRLHISTFRGAYDPAVPDSKNEPTNPSRVIETLPPSIERLCFTGQGDIEDDLEWIAESPTRFPNLCHVEISDPDVVNRLAQKFAKANVVLSLVKLQAHVRKASLWGF